MKRRNQNSLAICTIILSLWFVAGAGAQTPGVDTIPEGPSISVAAEVGFLSVLQHRIQFSRSGTYFSYVQNGGQDVLFPITRFSASLTWGRHTGILLYQPLRLETSDLLRSDLVVDSLLFPAGTPVNFLYSFPFYRASYLYKLVAGSQFDFSLGLSLQIRDATITFESLDGELYRTNRNVGPVPALKVYSEYRLNPRLWFAFEADGIYAPVSYLNGDNNDVTGAILDASLRAGMNVRQNYDLFLNLRYLGGGAEGASDNTKGPGDGYVKNWLNFLTVTLGFVYSL